MHLFQFCDLSSSPYCEAVVWWSNFSSWYFFELIYCFRGRPWISWLIWSEFILSFFSNLHAVPFLKFFYLVFSLCFLYRSYPVFKYSLTSTVITWRVIFLLLLVSKGNKFIRTFKIFVVLFFSIVCLCCLMKYFHTMNQCIVGLELMERVTLSLIQ